MNQLWWIGPLLLLVGYGSKWFTTTSSRREQTIPPTVISGRPDQQSLAALILHGEEPQVRILKLATGEWRTLTTLDLGLEGVDLLELLGIVKALSWAT